MSIKENINNFDELISLSEEIAKKNFFSLERKPSYLSLYWKNKLLTNRAQLFCQKLSRHIFNDTDLKEGKSMINTVLRKELGFHYLKTKIKSKDKGILYCFCFIKIIIMAFKLGFFKFLLMNQNWNLLTIILNYGHKKLSKYNLEIA